MAKRSTFQREKDLLTTSELYLRGVGQVEIAEQLKVTQATISNDIKEIQKRWLKHSMRNFDEARAEELAKVDELERWYRDAWERSTTYRVKMKDGITALIATDKKNPMGDDRYLKGIQWCIEKRCKILGLDAPMKQELTQHVINVDLVDEDD